VKYPEGFAKGNVGGKANLRDAFSAYPELTLSISSQSSGGKRQILKVFELNQAFCRQFWLFYPFVIFSIV